MIFFKYLILILAATKGQSVSVLNMSETLLIEKFHEKGGFFQGDMRMFEIGRNGLLDPRRRWQNNVVFYELAPAFTSAHKELIEKAQSEIEEATCIRFVPRVNEYDYLYISAFLTGCWSVIGRKGGVQYLNLEIPWCVNNRTIVHELIHVLGFEHEHSEPNRDEFVEIITENVAKNMMHNFEKYTFTQVTNYNFTYDYLSVMHYSAYAFSTNKKITIRTKDPSMQNVIGRLVSMSAKDISKINRMYNCSQLYYFVNYGERLHQKKIEQISIAFFWNVFMPTVELEFV